MKRSFNCTIPVYPHLKRYLEEFYTFPYPVNMRDEFGIFLYNVLRRKTDKKIISFSAEECGDSMMIIISEKYRFDHGCQFINDYQAYQINTYLDDMMMRHCYTWIDAMDIAGVPNRRAMVKWIEMYQLDSGSKDWFHRIQKNYYRHKNKKKENINRS